MFARSDLSYEAIDLPDRLNFGDDEMTDRSIAFLSQLRQRHSVRDFSDRAVPQEVIENAIRAAASAPSGANHQPWHFVAVRNAEIKHKIRHAAEEEERKFYTESASDEWLNALAPLGTDSTKTHLTQAAWLIIVFAQRWGEFDDGSRYKNYYVQESVGIATGFLLTTLHHVGVATLTHTPNPMGFLRNLLKRPTSEKAVMIIAVGHAAQNAKIPKVSTIKKPFQEIATII